MKIRKDGFKYYFKVKQNTSFLMQNQIKAGQTAKGYRIADN